MNTLNIQEIKKIPLDSNQYFQDTFAKTQIFLHHTEGGPDPANVISGWNNNVDRVATCVVIAGRPAASNDFKSGDIYQCFPSKNWAYHLGVKAETFQKEGISYRSIDRTSIGIEICSWGALTFKDGKYYNYVNREVSEDQVHVFDKPFRESRFYHKYTDEQIASVEKLLRYWTGVYNIPIKYIGDEIFDFSRDCLDNKTGVWTHCSVRRDKSDIFPQPELIQMLKSL